MAEYVRPDHRNIYDWLDDVRRRPSIHVRDRSILSLEAMVWGYGTAMGIHGVDEGVPTLGRHFAAWLRLRTGWSMSSGWGYALQEHATEIVAKPEEAMSDALDRFFRFLDEYRQLRVEVEARVVLAPHHQPTRKRVTIGMDTSMARPDAVEVLAYHPPTDAVRVRTPLRFLRHRYGDRFDDDQILLGGQLRDTPATLEDAKRWVEDELQVEPEAWAPPRP